MSPTLLSPTAWLLGLGGLAAALGLLHLLRVRLRPVEVDSLLFFQALQPKARPTTLWGRPSRWLMWLLGVALLAAAWAVFGGVRPDPDGHSRIALVDLRLSQPAAGNADLAAALLGDGLGPRGAVLGYGAAPVALLTADQPRSLLQERLDASRRDHTAVGVWAALEAASARLRDGDHIALYTTTATADHWPDRWPTADGGHAALRVHHRPAPSTAGPSGPADAAPPPQIVVHLHPTADSAAASIPMAVAADPTLATAESAGTDGVAAAPTADPDRATLVWCQNDTLIPRRAIATDHCPLPLTLRDRIPDAAPALPARAAGDHETPWVVDANSGEPLVAARRSADGSWRVEVVPWLLQPLGHRDVPVLIAGALRLLAHAADDRGGPVPALADIALVAERTGDGAPIAALPIDGAYHLPPGTWVEVQPDGAQVAPRQHWVATPSEPPPSPTAPPEPPTTATTVGIAGLWPWLFAVVALLLWSVDFYLHTRRNQP